VPQQPRVLFAAAAATALGALAAWAGWIEPRRTVVRRRTLRLPRWPRELDGLRVALVGDLHAGAPHVDARRVGRVAGAIARGRPDLVLLAGDFVDDEVTGATRVAPEAVAAELARLRPPLGTFAVLGNHDRAFGAQRVQDALRECGITVLRDDARRVAYRGAPLWVAGVDGLHDEPRDARPALTGIGDGDPVLLLVHEPDVFATVPDRVALTCAGHTHGGQVALPRLRARWTPSRFGERYARGLVVERGRHLLVTSGVGTSRLPLRLGAPPEVVLLRLRPAGRQRRRGRSQPVSRSSSETTGGALDGARPNGATTAATRRS